MSTTWTSVADQPFAVLAADDDDRARDTHDAQVIELPLARAAAPITEPTAVRPVREQQHWSVSLIVSLALHAMLVAIFLIKFDSAAPSEAPPPAAMVVELAIEPASPPVAPSEIPPGPEQVEAAPKPVEDRFKFAPLPEVDPALRPQNVVPIKREAAPTQTPNEAKEARETTAPAAVTAPVEDKTAAPVEGSNAAPPSNAEQAWEGRILAKLERNKRFPASAQRAGQEDTVFVRIVMDRRGKLLSAQVTRSRGFALLDREVMDLARRASPYPAPPASVAGEQVQIIVPVEFFIKRGR